MEVVAVSIVEVAVVSPAAEVAVSPGAAARFREEEGCPEVGEQQAVGDFEFQ